MKSTSLVIIRAKSTNLFHMVSILVPMISLLIFSNLNVLYVIIISSVPGLIIGYGLKKNVYRVIEDEDRFQSSSDLHISKRFLGD